MQQPRESKRQSEFNKCSSKKGAEHAADLKHLILDHVSPSSDTVQLPKPSAPPEQFDIFTPLFFNPRPPPPLQNSGPQSMWIEFQNM